MNNQMKMAATLLFILPFANAWTNTPQLRAQSLTPAMPHLLFQMHSQPDSCQCKFEDKCSCDGVLKFMECIKKSCEGDCKCIDRDVNHFAGACSAMEGQCSKVGLTCGQAEATCGKKKVAWPAGALAMKVRNDDKAKLMPAKEAAKKTKDSSTKKDAAKKVKKEVTKKSKKDAAKKSKQDAAKKSEKEATTDGGEVSKQVHDSKVQAVKSQGHRDFALGVIVALIIMSVFVSMASSANSTVSKSTWGTIDFIVVTFLAVSWFIVISHSLDYYKLTGLKRVLFHMAISVAFVLVAIFVSWRLRSNAFTLSVFGAIFTPMVMWVNAGFVQTVQQHGVTITEVLFHTLGLVIWYSFLSVALFHLVKNTCEREFGDDVVDSMTGGALAAGFVLLVHMAISGSYQQVDGPHTNPPTLVQTWIMLALSAVYLAAAIFLTPLVQKRIDASSYSHKRGLTVVSKILGWLPYLSGVMSFGHLIVDHAQGGGSSDAVTTHLVLAVASTAVGILMILLCAYVPALKNSASTTDVLVGLGGFMTGAALTSLMNNSVNMMLQGKGYAHPFIEKLEITVVLTAFVFPTYCLYLKPAIMEKTA